MLRDVERTGNVEAGRGGEEGMLTKALEAKVDDGPGIEDLVSVIPIDGSASGRGGAGRSRLKLVEKKADVLLLAAPSLVEPESVGEVA